MTAAAGSARALRGRRVVVVNWRDLDHRLAGGAEIYAWQMARALHEGGAKVSFVTAREPGAAAREQRDGIAVRRGGGPLGFYLFVLAWLLRHRRSIDAVADPACGLPSFSPLVLRRRTPVLLVVHHVHQAQFDAHFPAPVAAFGRWMERVAMRRVYRRHVTVAVSASTRHEMRRQLGWQGGIDLLANGADVPVAAAPAPPRDPRRIVVLGRLVTHKRVDLALAAVRRTLDTLPDDAATASLHVDVIGRGPELDRLRDDVRVLGLADRVTFHGYLPTDAKDALLARAAVHLCASDAEGWGQAVVDAAAWGVPTVARDVPGLRDSVLDGVTGRLVPDHAEAEVVVERLAEALGAALTEAADTPLARERADACVAWARRHDWAAMRARTRDLVADLLAGADRSPRHRREGRTSASSRPTEHPRDTRVAV